MSKFTILIRNGMTGRSYYRGTFDTEHEARLYRDKEAASSRKFASFELWTGTPDKPIKEVKGTLVNGVK